MEQRVTDFAPSGSLPEQLEAPLWMEDALRARARGDAQSWNATRNPKGASGTRVCMGRESTADLHR